MVALFMALFSGGLDFRVSCSCDRIDCIKQKANKFLHLVFFFIFNRGSIKVIIFLFN